MVLVIYLPLYSFIVDIDVLQGQIRYRTAYRHRIFSLYFLRCSSYQLCFR